MRIQDGNTYIFTATQGVISKDVAEEVAEQKRRGMRVIYKRNEEEYGMRVIYKRNEEEYYPRFEIYIYQPDNLEHYAQVLI